MLEKRESTEVVLFATHRLDSFILKQFDRLKNGMSDGLDLYLLLHDEKREIDIPANIKCYSFDKAGLEELKYTPISDSVLENNHFPLLKFYRDFPEYDFYWNIEYDVFFTGDWNYLFKAYRNCNADLVSSHVERFVQRPHWFWWKSINLKTLKLPSSGYLKSFNPIYRISNRALALLDQVLSDGNSGYQEVFIPSVLNY